MAKTSAAVTSAIATAADALNGAIKARALVEAANARVCQLEGAFYRLQHRKQDMHELENLTTAYREFTMAKLTGEDQ
jgi:hypothetical protein